MAEAGFNVTPDEALKIVKELAADPDSDKRLERLRAVATEASRLLEQLMKASND
jgi:hypothetical protein